MTPTPAGHTVELPGLSASVLAWGEPEARRRPTVTFPVVADAAAAPSRAVLVPGTGHFLHPEAPELVAEHVLASLGSPRTHD